MPTKHIPVMLEEVLELIQPKAGGHYMDCTLGGAGYTLAISEIAGERGGVIGIDMDKKAIDRTEEVIKDRKIKNIILENDNFANLQEIYKKHWSKKAGGLDGIVFDLGLSSDQLQDPGRGFSFQLDAPLDMAFGQESLQKTDDWQMTTEYIVNNYSQEKLIKIFKEYGEERFAGRIAAEIAKRRRAKPIETTGELVQIIGESVPAFYRNNKKYHFATKVFMALRIATNKELENLQQALPQALGLLKKGGRAAIVSFHSLEDRIVKNFFRLESKDCVCPPQIPECVCGHKAALKILTKKPLAPSKKEVENNPRSRSAKLRVAEKII